MALCPMLRGERGLMRPRLAGRKWPNVRYLPVEGGWSFHPWQWERSLVSLQSLCISQFKYPYDLILSSKAGILGLGSNL
jgi:hypothetical protein